MARRRTLTQIPAGTEHLSIPDVAPIAAEEAALYEENRTLSDEELRGLRATLKAIIDSSSQYHVADRVGISRSSLSKFMSGKKVHRGTINNLLGYVESKYVTRKTGFLTKDQYLSIADGMAAEVNNKEFIDRYVGEYFVLRAHVPSNLPLVSKLIIIGDTKTDVVRFRHEHVFPDELDVFIDGAEIKPEMPKIVFEGFIFHTSDRAFLLSAHHDTAQIKEIILDLPATHVNPSTKTFLGIILTVSAAHRVPFAARLMIRRVPHEPTEKQKKIITPGFKKWNNFPPQIRALFNAGNNYGILHLLPSNNLKDDIDMTDMLSPNVQGTIS